MPAILHSRMRPRCGERMRSKAMSMIRCDDCSDIFDSDADCDCFVEVGNMRRQTSTRVICRQCREDYPDDFWAERDNAP